MLELLCIKNNMKIMHVFKNSDAGHAITKMRLSIWDLINIVGTGVLDGPKKSIAFCPAKDFFHTSLSSMSSINQPI